MKHEHAAVGQAVFEYRVGHLRVHPPARIRVARTYLVKTWIELPLSVSLVQGWVNGSIANNGVLLKVTNESSGEMRFYPENHPDPLLRPKLVVEFQPANMGDLDGDGAVDMADVQYLAEAFGSVTGDPNYDAACDFNSDGSVDVVDLLIFGQDCWPQEKRGAES